MAASDPERAAAVVSRIWERWPDAALESFLVPGLGRRVELIRSIFDARIVGYGPTYVAALLDLGAKLDEAARPEAGEYEDLPEISAAGQAGLDQWYRERDARRIDPDEDGDDDGGGAR